jgi:hypothetical protein
MKDATIRLARHDDIDQLVERRRDFTVEDFKGPAVTRPGYEDDCRSFLEVMPSSAALGTYGLLRQAGG